MPEDYHITAPGTTDAIEGPQILVENLKSCCGVRKDLANLTVASLAMVAGRNRAARRWAELTDLLNL
jgi:hypothetical protein